MVGEEQAEQPMPSPPGSHGRSLGHESLRLLRTYGGTISVNGNTYACSSVMSPTIDARMTLCQMTALKMSASLPTWWVAAVATQIDWASIILPMTPPVLLAVQMRICACCSVRWTKAPVL